MWLKRLIVALVALSILTPSVTIAAPQVFGTAEFQKMYYKFDAGRGVWLDYTALSDNICRVVMRSQNWRDPVSGYACWEPVVARGSMLVIPQINIFGFTNNSSSSATMRNAGKKLDISNADLAQIAYAAADAMTSPGAFTRYGLSLNKDGDPADVFTEAAVQCDALGWILKRSCRVLGVQTKRDRARAYRASEMLNDAILHRTGHSLVAINDEYGREAIVCVLKRVADTLMRS